MPEQQVQTPTGADQNASSDTTDSTDTTDEVIFNDNVSWYNAGLTNKALSLDVDNNKTVYLLGDEVHNFLSNSTEFAKTYCVEIQFQSTQNNSPKRLRVKALASYSNNFSQNKTTRFLRVNLSTSSGNNFCLKNSMENISGVLTSVPYNDATYYGSLGLSTDVVQDTNNVCVGCQGFINSTSVILYSYNESSNILERVPNENIQSSLLSMRIDMNSNSDGGQSSCSQSECNAKGFDCCVDGQCVDEKTVKVAGAQSDPTGFAIAEQEKLNDPNWFLKYPQFYYQCLERPPTDDGDDDGSDDGGDDGDPTTDPIDEAQARLNALISDYECLTELETNSNSSPFHSNPYNSSASYAKCNTTDSTNNMFYNNVLIRLYNNCGCEEKTDLTQMVSNCPAYTYRPTYQRDSFGNETTTIISIACVTPEPAKTPLPFEDLDVNVSPRTAPHRFFDTNNVEIFQDNVNPTGSSGIQEGTEFTYLDDYKIFPNNGSFNMNSIIGKMDITLGQAKPALKIDVEADKQYLISTRQGQYRSCPTCGKDSWFNNFSAFPTTNYGVGARAVGYTTRRDTYVSNTTLGNYEDLKFNRACHVPPTMLPFSHTSESTDQQQRLKRLKAQAALFINGYQRDWYGFNKGALIGSFDGVTWFAVGAGRIVNATSNKLYLAINAPFADLASGIDHTVSVQEYDFTSTGARFDYLPDEATNSPFQNAAGSCQQYHSCETDSHCITKLGWEYSCVDVTNYQTKWPSFNPNGASENASTSRTGTIAEFLQQAALPPGSGTKRCVYRGAGTPCRQDSSNIADEGVRKSLTCAPNFYCANLNSTGAFNSEVARFARPLDELLTSNNHLFGMDSDVLGRPLNYLGKSGVSLDADIREAIEENLLLIDPTGAGKFGICRPGKQLPTYSGTTATSNWQYDEQHSNRDSQERTDYISQIGSCNPLLFTELRYASCPILDNDGNYVHTQDQFINDAYSYNESNPSVSQSFVIERLGFAQNSCSHESLSSSVSLSVSTLLSEIEDFSAFKTIEGKTLNSGHVITEPTLAGNACLRKAGAVCHTDLDCSPNRKMASVIDIINPEYFGNNAEKKYFEEYLVCGQATAEPQIGDDDYSNYNLHNNRCCRPAGETLTMYSEDTPNVPESTGIQTNIWGSMAPNNANRYSRYSVMEADVNPVTKEAAITRVTANTQDNDANKTLDLSVNITNTGQWETIHNTAARTCCGSKWVRKFEDGSNNWANYPNKLSLDVSNFQCLNYRSGLYLSENASAYGMTQSNFDRDKIDFCVGPVQVDGGCIQQPIGTIDSFSVSKPILNNVTNTMRSSSDLEFMENLWGSLQGLWSYSLLMPYDGLEAPLVLDWNETIDDAKRRFLTTRVPAWVTFDSPSAALGLTVSMANPSGGADLTCTEVTPVNSQYNCTGNILDNGGLCDPTRTSGTDVWKLGGVSCDNNLLGPQPTSCCFTLDPVTRKLTVGYDDQTILDSSNYEKNELGMRIEYTAVGTLAWEMQKANSTTVNDESVIDHRRSANPGNALYYLKKLAKLEYIGIPQMAYEPIYCNDNYQKMVPGIFQASAFGQKLETVMDFLNHPRTFYNSNVDTPWQPDTATGVFNADSLNQNLTATSELLDHASVFSASEFKCCLELGTSLGANEDAGLCCSGFAVEGDNEQRKCGLPTGTNLNVYFNKFVSGEGLTFPDDSNVSALSSSDFDAETGEPILSTDVLKKLTSIGEAFCESGKVRRGGAFGSFAAQPFGSLGQVDGGANIFSIVDSPTDNGESNDTTNGYTDFYRGYRWNHHIYCDLGGN